MVHRRTPTVIQAMKLRDQQEHDDAARPISAAAIRVLAAAATVLAPSISLPQRMRNSLSLDSSASTSTTICGDDDHDRDDSMSMSSLDLYPPNMSPMSPGTPSKLFPHAPRFPSPYATEECGALTKAQISLRRFVSRIFATLPSSRVTRAPVSLPLKAGGSPSSTFSGFPTRTHAPLRRRATFLALLALIALCAWTLLTSSLGDPGRQGRSSEGIIRTLKDWRSNDHNNYNADERSRLLSSASFRAATSETPVRKSKPRPLPVDSDQQQQSSSRIPVTAALTFTPSEELAALTAFIAALPWNALPSYTDTRNPLDPTVVLDFDPSHPRARGELEDLVRETWQLNPVVLYGRSWHAPTREVRALLQKLGVDFSGGGVFEVDVAERVDGEIVHAVLSRVMPVLSPSDSDSQKAENDKGQLELPLLLVGGKPMRYAEIFELTEGELSKMLRDVGAKMVQPGKKKKIH